MLASKYAPVTSRGKEGSRQSSFFSSPEAENLGTLRETLLAFHQNAADELRAVFGDELSVGKNESTQPFEILPARVAKL